MKRMQEQVELLDGTFLSLTSLPGRVPHIWYMGTTHLVVCERLATQYQIAPHLHDAYVNLLFMASNRAKQITALIILTRERKLLIRSVRSSFIGHEFSDLLGESVDIQPQKPRHLAMLGIKQYRHFLIKVIAHRLFRCFRSYRILSKSILRAWIDTTDTTYPHRIHNAMLLIYPFAGSVVRQLRYVLLCRRQKRSFSIMGLPYRIGDILRIARHWNNRETLLIEAEVFAFRAHAHELIAMGVDHVDTTDDFSAAACELHDDLIAHGVTTPTPIV